MLTVQWMNWTGFQDSWEFHSRQYSFACICKRAANLDVFSAVPQYKMFLALNKNLGKKNFLMFYFIYWTHVGCSSNQGIEPMLPPLREAQSAAGPPGNPKIEKKF